MTNFFSCFEPCFCFFKIFLGFYLGVGRKQAQRVTTADTRSEIFRLSTNLFSHAWANQNENYLTPI